MALTKVHTNIIEGLEEHIGDSDYLPLRGGTITGDLNISTEMVDWEDSRLDPSIIYNKPEGMNKNSLVVKGAVTEKVYTWGWTPDQRTHEIDPTNGSTQVSNWPVGYQPGVTWYTIDSDKWKNGQSVNLTINMETVLLEDRDVMWPDRIDAVHNPNPCEINWINSPTSTEGMDPWTGDWTSRNYDTKIVPNSNAYNVLIVKLWKTNDTMYGQRVGGYGPVPAVAKVSLDPVSGAHAFSDITINYNSSGPEGAPSEGITTAVRVTDPNGAEVFFSDKIGEHAETFVGTLQGEYVADITVFNNAEEVATGQAKSVMLAPELPDITVSATAKIWPFDGSGGAISANYAGQTAPNNPTTFSWSIKSVSGRLTDVEVELIDPDEYQMWMLEDWDDFDETDKYIHIPDSEFLGTYTISISATNGAGTSVKYAQIESVEWPDLEDGFDFGAQHDVFEWKPLPDSDAIKKQRKDSQWGWYCEETDKANPSDNLIPYRFSWQVKTGMATGDGPQKLEWVDPDGIVLYEFKPFILSRDNEFGHPYNLPNSAETEHCFPTKRGIYSLRATISNPVETRVIENRMPNFLDSNDAENSPTIIFEPRISHQHSNVKLMWDANDDTNVNVELKNPAGTSIGNWTYNKDIRGQEFNCVDEGVYTAEITSTHLGVDMAITAELTASEYVDPTPVIFFSPDAVRQYREINVHWDNKVAPALHWSTGPNGRLTILEVFDPIGRVIYSTQEASGRNSLFPDMLGTYTATLIIKDRSNNIAASAEASIESKP